MTQTSVKKEGLSSQEMYDLLMEQIEPDLTSANIQSLDEKYADESAEDRRARLESYTIAFEIFKEALDDLEAEVQGDAEMLEWHIAMKDQLLAQVSDDFDADDATKAIDDFSTNS